MFAFRGKFEFRSVCAVAGGIVLLLVSLHWRVSESDENLATLAGDVKHMVKAYAEIKADVKTHIQQGK